MRDGIQSCREFMGRRRAKVTRRAASAELRQAWKRATIEGRHDARDRADDQVRDCRRPIPDDGWTVCTADGMASAHFEHTVLITKDEPEILTWRAKTQLK